MAYVSELDEIIKNLSTEQVDHFKTISWLLNPMGPRGAGRTHLMALVFIEHSLKYGIWIIPFNHNHPHHPYRENEIMEKIKKIINEIPSLHLRIKRNRNIGIEIMITNKRKESWYGVKNFIEKYKIKRRK